MVLTIVLDCAGSATKKLMPGPTGYVSPSKTQTAPPRSSTPRKAFYGCTLSAAKLNASWKDDHLDDAERTYQQILAMLQAQPTSPHQQMLALQICFQRLGRVAQLRGRLDEAEDWHRKALAIKEELGGKSDTAETYYQLGLVAQYRGLLDEAADWYRKVPGHQRGARRQARHGRQLPPARRVAQLRGRLDEAEDWYRQSLAIKEELGDQPR